MRIITLFIAVVFIACNNSSEKKTDIKDTGSITIQMIQQPPVRSDTIFYGMGTEPFWFVYVLKDNKIVFNAAEGTPVEVPYVEGITADNVTKYSSSANGSSIELIITKKECSDGMSEREFTYQVELSVNKTSYRGCGNDAIVFDNE